MLEEIGTRLQGHTSNVRALALDTTGKLCLSGGSDSTIRLWDLGQQRCVQSYSVHSDSVWALVPDASFSRVFSGAYCCIPRRTLARATPSLPPPPTDGTHSCARLSPTRGVGGVRGRSASVGSQGGRPLQLKPVWRPVKPVKCLVSDA
jgi:hypothetical protein